ncbi:hypothetical protein BDW59DRAFT_153619 [Aspergillus cavernicola]|uniref:Uncharacterized protein n=1 Tax=Aspergillus cavernicola TaxID=176166 RepID=A0ABR4HK06_9EURO
MKITVLRAMLLAALSPAVLGQEGESYGAINFYGPDINDAYAAASVCLDLGNDSPQSVSTIQIQGPTALQCTFYSEFECEGEQITLGPGGHGFNTELLVVGSWQCTLSA